MESYDSLVNDFEAGAISPADFGHESHVRVAWGLARRHGHEEGLSRMAAGIRDMASRAGRPQAYHETITRAWFELIAPVQDLAARPELFDKRLLGRYYSPERLAAGRERWLEPDLAPLSVPDPREAAYAPSMDASRWATFDCYGTLVDWNQGIQNELGRLFGADRSEDLLALYHRVEPRIQSQEPSLSYREVMARALGEVAAQAGRPVPSGEEDALGSSLPDWPVFSDVRPALREAHDRGWKLAVLSNTDRDLIEGSLQTLAAPFELAIVASEIGSYKPAHGHWRAFYECTGADPQRHVHVAQSHFHDIVPAVQLGIQTVWINRLGEHGDPRPTRELPGLTGLAEVLDGLVPAPEEELSSA